MDEQLELWHYHVTLVSPQLSKPPIVTRYINVAIVEFNKLTNLVMLLSGMTISKVDKIKNDEQKVIFADGTVVHLFRCTQSCLDERKDGRS